MRAGAWVKCWHRSPFLPKPLHACAGVVLSTPVAALFRPFVNYRPFSNVLANIIDGAEICLTRRLRPHVAVARPNASMITPGPKSIGHRRLRLPHCYANLPPSEAGEKVAMMPADRENARPDAHLVDSSGEYLQHPWSHRLRKLDDLAAREGLRLFVQPPILVGIVSRLARPCVTLRRRHVPVTAPRLKPARVARQPRAMRVDRHEPIGRKRACHGH